MHLISSLISSVTSSTWDKLLSGHSILARINGRVDVGRELNGKDVDLILRGGKSVLFNIVKEEVESAGKFFGMAIGKNKVAA